MPQRTQGESKPPRHDLSLQPQRRNSLLENFCLHPSPKQKFLLSRAWSDQKTASAAISRVSLSLPREICFLLFCSDSLVSSKPGGRSSDVRGGGRIRILTFGPSMANLLKGWLGSCRVKTSVLTAER